MFIALVFGVAFIILIAIYVTCKKANVPGKTLRNYSLVAIISMLAWLAVTLFITRTSMFRHIGTSQLQPVLLMLPPLAVIVALMASPRFNKLIEPVDNFWFIYLQAYRILREFILLLLFRYSVIPSAMTMEGKNFDVLIGITAPFVAYYWFKSKKWYRPLTLVWNLVGLFFILNTLYSLFYQMPGANDMDVQNDLLFSFPFIWMPSFLAPFGIFLHLLSIRKVFQKEETPEPYLNV